MLQTGTVVTGAQNTSQFTNKLVAYSFAATVAKLFPNGNAPLFALSSMLPETTAVQTTHGYWTKSMAFPTAQINGAKLANATTLVFDSTAELIPGMVIFNYTTGERILVKTIASGTDATVQRAFGTTAAQDIADNEVLYVIGNAHEESSLRPQAMAIQPVEANNLTQIFRNTWALSGTAQAVKTIAGDTPVAENRQDCMALHSTLMEHALFFGERFSGSLNGQPIRTMDGLLADLANKAPTNITTAGATTNFSQLDAALDPCLDTVTDPRSSNSRLLFVGGQARRVINKIGRLNGTYQLMDGQTTFGLQFQNFRTSRGSFNMIEHPLLNAYGRNSPLSKMAIAVDLSAIRVAYLQGRKTSNKEFNMAGAPVDNGIDAIGGTLTTEMTLENVNPSAHAVIHNLTDGAAG